MLTHFSTRAKIRLDLAAEYDKKLQESRLAAYKELWAMLEPLSRYGRDQPVRRATHAGHFRQDAGMVLPDGRDLSRQTKPEAILHLEGVDAATSGQGSRDDPDVSIPERELEQVIEAASLLRTALSDDIGTKRLSRL